MKKYLVLSALVLCSFVLYGYFGKQKNVSPDDTKNIAVEHNSATKKQTAALKKIKKLSLEVESLRKENINPDDFTVSYLVEEKGEIGSHYKELKDGLFDRMNNKIPAEEIVGDIEKQVEITVYDDKKNTIANAEVFLWGYFLGNTDGEGHLKKTVATSDVMSSWVLSAKKDGYMRGTQTKNILYEKGSLIELSIVLKKSISFAIKSEGKKKVIKFNNKMIDIIAEDDCLLKNSKGDCHEKEAEGEVTFVKPADLGNMGLPMKALVDGKIIPLESNGMAFTQFKDENGNILQWNPEKKMKQCYDFTDKQISDWKNNSWGYRWFDEKNGLWKENKNVKITLSGNKGCFETSDVY